MKLAIFIQKLQENLDECLNYSECILKLPDLGILFYELPNYFSHFNQLLSKDLPKLLGKYDTFTLYFSYSTSPLLITLSLVS